MKKCICDMEMKGCADRSSFGSVAEIAAAGDPNDWRM